MTNDLKQPFQIGNLKLQRSEKPVNAFCWGVYLSGNRTDVMIRGTIIAELMLWGGKVSLVGTEGKYDACCTCTTLDLHGEAVLEMKHVRLGRPLQWMQGKPSPIIGQITVSDRSRLIGENVSLGRLVLITRGEGSMTFRGYTRSEEVKQMGGSITFQGEHQP